MKTLKSLYQTYREVFWYRGCGAGTTVVNLVVFLVCAEPFKDVRRQSPTANPPLGGFPVNLLPTITNRDIRVSQPKPRAGGDSSGR